MGYQSQNAEVQAKFEGQAGQVGKSSSESSMNEVLGELAKKYNFSKTSKDAEGGDVASKMGQSGGLKNSDGEKGGSAYAEKDGKAIGVDELSKKKVGAMGSEAQGKKGIEDETVKQLPAGGAEAAGQKAQKLEEKLKAGGESHAEKAKAAHEAANDAVNQALLATGAALGPLGLPLVTIAGTRMLSDRLGPAKSAAEENVKQDVIQRQKMLDSWHR